MYSVEFLDDEKFEQLPYKDMGISLGVADPKIRKAYVRRTGVKPLDVLNAMHELEHLEEGKLGKYAHHYENGVYYKKFGEAFNQIIPQVLSLFNPILGGAMGIGQSLFGGGSKQSQSQQEYNQPNISMAIGQQPTQPNVVQAGQGVSGFGASGTQSSAVKNLRNQPQFQDIDRQRYGNVSGGRQLLDIFGGF